ncbi:endo-1,C4-beta-glucanase [Myxococcus stipitatus]|uniref:endo-1,C4-beta-glucanase n=1 Tax=Myxococcus stipitatus TaxID=83455 RepID=UPI0030CC8D60
MGPTTVDFNYPNASQIHYSLQVIGGTLAEVDIDASGNSATDRYHASAERYLSSTQPPSISGWLAMIPVAEVTVTGTATLRTASGALIQRTLNWQTLNMLQGQNSVSWTFDLANKGNLAGAINFPPSASIASHEVRFQGIYGTATQGIEGRQPLQPRSAYDIELPPGMYDVYLRTHFMAGPQYSDTKLYRVTVTTGATTSLNFTESLGTAQAPLLVTGFFSNADVDWARMGLVRVDPLAPFVTQAVDTSLENGRFDFSLPYGNWARDVIELSFINGFTPTTSLVAGGYLNANVSRQFTSQGNPPLVVPPDATVSFGTEVIPLVKTTLYFDVREASPTDPEILVTRPSAQLSRSHYSGGARWVSISNSYGPDVSKSVATLDVVAEPGTYQMTARAEVNGGTTTFSARTLTIAEPTLTPFGTNVSITPVDKQDLKVNVTFPQVTGGGITSVVESPLAPELPEGIKMFCPDGASAEGVDCSPVFYDIESTAQFPQATVCIRRKFQGNNGLAQFLRLYHYNENAQPSGQWEELPPPPGEEPAFDCSADLQACGCASEAACGINTNAEPPISVIRVCGVTNSFSPFAVGATSLAFTNKVNGVEYQGPTGPAALQTWTAEASGKYRITATGASGASAAAGYSGGCGAKVSGVFTLQANDTVHMLVGQKGTAATYSAGGGGGSFVTLNGNPLLIAGGGGGLRSGAQVPGRSGSTGTAGTAGSTSATYASGFIAGGTNGQGGTRAAAYGAGGGGWFTSGASDGSYGEGGFSFLTGGKGGAGKSCGGLAHGGYGGGGAGNGCYGGGGGGGYSGGGGGRVGGGGGSLNTGAQPTQAEGVCTPSGHGRITIEFVRP